MMNEAGRIWTDEQETPAPKPGQLLIEVHASMVSPGTELGGVKRRRENPGSEARQRPFGYTNAGVVIGKEGDCDEFEIGDRVAGMGGGYALHATYACVPHNLCAKVPDDVSAEAAASYSSRRNRTPRRAARTHPYRRERCRRGLGHRWAICVSDRQSRRCLCDRFGSVILRIGIAENAGIHRAINVSETDPIPIAQEFTNGYGMDCGIIAFGGDATSAFQQIRAMLKTAQIPIKLGGLSSSVVRTLRTVLRQDSAMLMLSVRRALDPVTTTRIMNTARIIHRCLSRGQHNAIWNYRYG